ncbi:MAG TPA: pitrilysin family protein, partial [Patescibacteria group bacterium]
HEICIPYQYANIAVDILLDTLFNSLINKSEFIKEKEVIKKEILRYRYDMDRFLLYYVWFPLIFQGTKLVEPCIGSEEKIDEFKYTDIKKFLEANFVANNMTFIISGNISQQKSLDLFEKKIKSITPSIFSSIIPTIAPGKKDQILIFPYESDQIGIAIGIPTVPKANGKRHAFDIFENMLSRGFGGSISDKLREAGGLVYSLYSSQENLLDSGFLVFTTMTEKKNAKKVLQIILKEFNRMRIGAFTQEEIENAVKNLVGSLQIGLETSNAIAHWYGLQELLNPREILHPEDKIAKYKSLSKKELANIAHEYFAKKNIYIGILGDIKKQEVQNLID